MTQSAHSGALSQNALRCALCGSRGSPGGDPVGPQGEVSFQPTAPYPRGRPVVPTDPSQATRLDGVTVTARASARRPVLWGGGPDRQSAVASLLGRQGVRTAFGNSVARLANRCRAQAAADHCPRPKALFVRAGEDDLPLQPGGRQRPVPRSRPSAAAPAPARSLGHAAAVARLPRDAGRHGRPTAPPLADPLRPLSGPRDDKNEETP
jgi:hypothetical protein